MARRSRLLVCLSIVAGLVLLPMTVPHHALAQSATPLSQTSPSDSSNDPFNWDDAKTILAIAGGLFGLLGGTGGLIGLRRTLNQDRRDQNDAFFATYEKSIATLTKQYDREINPVPKEERRRRLEAVENDYQEQLEAYRASSALRKAAHQGAVASGDPAPSEALSTLLDDLLKSSQSLSPALRTVEYYVSRGTAAYELRRYEEALSDYNRSLELLPDDPIILSNRGVTLDGLGRYEGALADYNRSLELRPDDPFTLNNRGVTLTHLERYEEALSDYNRSLELQPDNPTTFYNRGSTLDDLTRYEEALADFNRSLELRPDHPSTLDNRGVTLTHLERYEEALSDYNRSLELRPDDPSTVYNSACVFSVTRRLREALRQLNVAISLDPKYRAVARKDEDFDNLRSDPRLSPEFEALVTEPARMHP